VQGRGQVKKCGEDTHGERGQRAYNGVLSGAPSGVDSGEEPLSGGEGRSLKPLQLLDAQREQQIRLVLRILQTGESSSKRDRLLSPRKTSPNLHQSEEQPPPRKKWGGYVHHVATPLASCLREGLILPGLCSPLFQLKRIISGRTATVPVRSNLKTEIENSPDTRG